MKRMEWMIAFLLFTFLLYVPLAAEESCPALTVPKIVPGTDIFSEQQEMWLGDAQAASIEQTVAIVHDPAMTQYLQGIVDRLTKGLPPNQIKFRVKLIESPNAEAFSIAGGKIYISRKIVALTRDEDEMAGVLAHEMGHIVAKHAATETSENFRKILNATQVGDSDDINTKWNQYLSNYRRKGMSEGAYEKWYELEEREQLQADSVALYLTTRAGYSSQDFGAFFDRLAETKGNIGGFWSNLFGTLKPDAKRLRQIVKNLPAMPPGCVATRTETAAQYNDWKKSVIEYSSGEAGRQESLPGLVSKKVLTERLRPEIQNIRISPDGRYVAAQDDGNVFILSRQPLKAVVRFDALDADPVQFTPDSRSVVLLFDAFQASPRVERWDIASQKRVEVHEVYVRDGCLLSKLSPDGKTLACLGRDIESGGFLKYNLDLFDVATGTPYFHKKGWVTLDLLYAYWYGGYAEIAELWSPRRKMLEEMSPMAFSPDGHYFAAGSRQNTLAIDLMSRNPIDLPGNVRALLSYSFVFLADNRLVGIAGNSGEKSEVVEFPSGKVVYKGLSIGGSRLDAVAHGDHVLLRPIKDHPVGIFDLKQNKIVVASKRSAIAVWDDNYIAERLDGDLLVFDMSTIKPLGHAQLPDAPLGNVKANAISPDLNWLAVSQSSRGAVWNLQSGQRLYHIRGFSAAYFGPDGGMYADFPKYLTTDRTIARAALNTQDIRPEQTLDEKKHTIEVGRFLLSVVPAKEDNTYTDVNLELWDLVDEKLVWSKHFPHERPGYHVDPRANSLALYWQASSQSARALAKEDPEVAAELSRVKDKDGTLFVQVFDLDTGKLKAQTVLDTGKHSFQVVEAIGTKDRLIIADNEHRVLLYGWDGQQKGVITGGAPEVSTKGDLLTVRTEEGALELYDLATGQKRATYEFNSRVAFNGFSADGKRLLVLTSDQVVYLLDPAAKDNTNAVATK
ncbi:MAG: M48 family metalloprotease [Candidatus Korobacteraceae bacterium]